MNPENVVALFGARAQEKRFEILTQNLANIATAGYKADVGLFETVLVELGAQDSTEGSTDVMEVPVEQFAGLRVDFSPGPLKQTGNSLDVALLGEGFFAVETPDGVRYTRRGGFMLNAEGQMVTSGGHVVQGQGGAIALGGGGQISIDSQGNVALDRTPVGTLRVVTFPDKSRLEKLSGGLFRWLGVPTAVTDVDKPTVVQGSLEMSNVSPLVSMTRMITVLRTYEANMKAVSSLTDAERRAASEIARLV